MSSKNQKKQEEEKCRWCGCNTNTSVYFLPLCNYSAGNQQIPDVCMFGSKFQHMCRFFKEKED